MAMNQLSWMRRRVMALEANLKKNGGAETPVVAIESDF